MIREILVTNDDAYDSRGVKYLAEFMRRYGNVTVVAPRTPQSGKATAISMNTLFRLEKMSEEPSSISKGSITWYCFNGTPVDCAKMGINLFVEEGRMPDMLISGINHGSNASIAVAYSGTVGAAIEGAIYGIQSIALSIDEFSPDLIFDGIDKYLPQIIDNLIAHPLSEGIILNINFPNLPLDQIQGIRFAHQGKGRWTKEFDRFEGPDGRVHYVMGGYFINQEQYDVQKPIVGQSDADHLLNNYGYVAIVPLRIDNTDHKEKTRLEKEWSFS
ncbi:MAG: 5'/3'-nucleotidase SurE [Bacteroidales bacterium]|nr:5'/3'-nucleotidase SurE [Bacteroidales bacterium]